MASGQSGKIGSELAMEGLLQNPSLTPEEAEYVLKNVPAHEIYKHPSLPLKYVHNALGIGEGPSDPVAGAYAVHNPQLTSADLDKVMRGSDTSRFRYAAEHPNANPDTVYSLPKIFLHVSHAAGSPNIAGRRDVQAMMMDSGSIGVVEALAANPHADPHILGEMVARPTVNVSSEARTKAASNPALNSEQIQELFTCD